MFYYLFTNCELLNFLTFLFCGVTPHHIQPGPWCQKKKKKEKCIQAILCMDCSYVFVYKLLFRKKFGKKKESHCPELLTHWSVHHTKLPYGFRRLGIYGSWDTFTVFLFQNKNKVETPMSKKDVFLFWKTRSMMCQSDLSCFITVFINMNKHLSTDETSVFTRILG